MALDDSVKEVRLPWSLRLFRRCEFPHNLGICERLFSARLEHHGVCWVKTSVGPQWKLDLANSTHRWIVYGKYEGPGFLTWVRRNLNDAPTIVDSGANIGQMLLYFASYFPKARILAFEPGRYQADWLSECLKRNPLPAVRLFRFALSDGERTMYLDHSGHAHSHGSQNVVRSEASGESIEVIRLSTILQEERVSKVDLWKLDVEGHEIPALEGAKEWLQTKRIKALWVETRGENGKAIERYMRQFGYAAYLPDRRGKARKLTLLNSDNTLFLPA
jgi:FkbM family methyltransferase